MPMHRAFVDSMIVLLAATVIAAGSAPSVARVTITPAERCSRLGREVDEAIKGDASAKQVTAASELQKQAIRLCAHKKRAQGIRTFAKALKLLGQKPSDID
jgi:hypothetical protein